MVQQALHDSFCDYKHDALLPSHSPVSTGEIDGDREDPHRIVCVHSM